MRLDRQKTIPFLVTLLLGTVYVSFYYGPILTSPNDYLFSDSGDGIKNYFTYAYHIRHDSSYTEHEGMNYPYGENYLYTDCHPVLANAFKFLSSSFPYFDTHSVGLLNLFMILGILATFIVLYLVLIELKLNAWASVFFAFCIAVLAPQIYRLESHLALSYSLAVPLSWLLILKSARRTDWKYLILLFLNNVFWMFIHAYLGMIVLAFLFAFTMVNYFSNKREKGSLVKFVSLLSSVLLPVIIFYAYTKATDIHVGRTDNPSGFFLYNAEIDDVLLPPHTPFYYQLDALLGGILKLEWEARGYVGMINSLLLVCLVVFSLVGLFSKKARRRIRALLQNTPLNISLIAALIVLLFAMGVPFKQFPDLLEFFPVFKQFRATGRFVWPFYFVFSTFAGFVLYKHLLPALAKKSLILAAILVVGYFSLYLIEGNHYHSYISGKIKESPNLFDKSQLPNDFLESLNIIDPEDYQAIVSLPFYYQGSESFSRPRSDAPMRNSLLLSYYTSIPNFCANLTRTSVTESKKIVQLVTPNYYEKPIQGDLPNRKPFLIVKSGNNLTKYEEAIYKKVESIGINQHFELLKIDYNDLFSDDRHIPLEEYASENSNLAAQGDFSVSRESSVLYYEDFETTESDITYRGKGSFSSVKKGKNTLAEFPSSTFQEGTDYELSMWMHNGVPDALNLWFRVIIEEYDEANDQWYSTTFFPVNAEVIDGDWSLLEGVFRVRDPKNKVYLITKGKNDSKATLHVDDILLKERGVDVYRWDESKNCLFFNNHGIQQP